MNLTRISRFVQNQTAWCSHRHRRCGGEWNSEEYSVFLTQTQCHLGGFRTWFLCPARGCGRRVPVLYGGGIFACHHCHQLAYESQRVQPHYRALSRAQKLHVRLGGSGAVADGLPPKPKGMHRKKYQVLAELPQARDGDGLGGGCLLWTGLLKEMQPGEGNAHPKQTKGAGISVPPRPLSKSRGIQE